MIGITIRCNDASVQLEADDARLDDILAAADRYYLSPMTPLDRLRFRAILQRNEKERGEK